MTGFCRSLTARAVRTVEFDGARVDDDWGLDGPSRVVGRFEEQFADAIGDGDPPPSAERSRPAGRNRW